MVEEMKTRRFAWKWEKLSMTTMQSFSCQQDGFYGKCKGIFSSRTTTYWKLIWPAGSVFNEYENVTKRRFYSLNCVGRLVLDVNCDKWLILLSNLRQTFLPNIAAQIRQCFCLHSDIHFTISLFFRVVKIYGYLTKRAPIPLKSIKHY